MKNIFYLSLLIMVALGGYSCKDASFLDETITTDLDYERIFSDSLMTEGFLLEIYRGIGYDVRPNRFSKDLGKFNEVTLGGLHTACDEAEFRAVSEVSADLQFATGTVNPVVITDDAWRIPYENIRRVNVFFRGLEIAPIEEGRKNTLKAEARFLRAWYYASMMRHYGGIPLIGDTVYSEYDKMKDTRNTYDECLQYVVDECEKAITEGRLVVKPSRTLYGRVGAGACKALIARMKLYAASPLHNGNSEFVKGTDCPAELLGYPTFEAKRWEEAMLAAKEIIESNEYKLYELHTNPEKGGIEAPGHGFYAVFQASKEQLYKPDAYDEVIIDDRGLGTNGKAKEQWFQPPTRTGTTKSGFAYQNLVDAFPMSNGLSITDPESKYDPKNPYKDRDPRLYNTVLYDGTMLAYGNNEEDEVKIYLNANGTSSGQDAVYQGTPTGYYISKMVSRYIAANSVHGSPQEIPLIRYAEILLNYIEALNEYQIATNGDGEADAQTYLYLKQIRKRGGININDDPANTSHMFGLKPNMTRLEMRKAIQHERRIELAIEGHRFFDVRRWMIAKETESQIMTGMEIRLNNDGDKEYKEFQVRQRSFRDAMYFWPIPYRETIKLPNLIQNPNYNF